METSYQGEACTELLPALGSCHLNHSPFKGVPEITFQSIGLRLSPTSQSCAAISSLAYSPTNQSDSISTVTIKVIRVLVRHTSRS